MNVESSIGMESKTDASGPSTSLTWSAPPRLVKSPSTLQIAYRFSVKTSGRSIPRRQLRSMVLKRGQEKKYLATLCLVAEMSSLRRQIIQTFDISRKGDRDLG